MGRGSRRKPGGRPEHGAKHGADCRAGLKPLPRLRFAANLAESEAAVAILRPLPRDQPPFQLTENAMLYLLQRQPHKGLGHPYTVHGFRSSFRDWAAETTDHAGEVVEMALAHAIRNRAEAAYR